MLEGEFTEPDANVIDLADMNKPRQILRITRKPRVPTDLIRIMVIFLSIKKNQFLKSFTGTSGDGALYARPAPAHLAVVLNDRFTVARYSGISHSPDVVR